MTKLIFGIALFTLVTFLSKNDQFRCESEAEIISFNPQKCGGCWGWIIKVGTDTIKTTDDLNIGIGKNFGYRFNDPEKVYITLGDSITMYSRDYTYYQVRCIEKRE